MLPSMRLDAHQHFWRYDAAHHVWMTEAMGALRRDYLPRDLSPLLEATGFAGTIAVQARQMVEETEWLLDLAGSHAFIRGVVGWVDLRSPDLGAQLGRLGANPKLVGVRHVVHDEPDDDFMLLPEFRRGIARLGPAGLTYDLLLRPPHLRAAIRLVDEFKDQPFVLDHIAKPGVGDVSKSPWKEDILRLAERPNVSCKLSGLVTEADWGAWRPDDFRPALEVVLDAFGADRLMIGSDWPVCTLAADYATTMGVVMDFVRDLGAAEQAGILGENCARFYGVARVEAAA
jgi:L-fuconolactonase